MLYVATGSTENSRRQVLSLRLSKVEMKELAHFTTATGFRNISDYCRYKLFLKEGDANVSKM